MERIDPNNSIEATRKVAGPSTSLHHSKLGPLSGTGESITGLIYPELNKTSIDQNNPIGKNGPSDLTFLQQAQIQPDKINRVNIPKRIFQTWKNTQVPEHWKSSPASIKKHMPDWEYYLVTDEEMDQIVKIHFPDFYPIWKAFPYPIQRVDAWRYCMLYLYGGIYLDLDFELLQPLDQLFTSDNQVYLVNSGNLSSVYTNAFLASQPGAPIWLEMIEYMKNPTALKWYHNVSKHLKIMYSTGPLALDYVARRSKTTIGVLPTVLITPCNVCKLSRCKAMKNAWVRQLEGNSWHSWDSTLYNFCFCNWKIILPVLILFVVILLIIWLWMFYRKSYQNCRCYNSIESEEQSQWNLSGENLSNYSNENLIKSPAMNSSGWSAFSSLSS